MTTPGGRSPPTSRRRRAVRCWPPRRTWPGADTAKGSDPARPGSWTSGAPGSPPADGITVLAGDFNATPASSTVRYLKGLQALEQDSTYWVDAWETAGDGGPGWTFEPDNPWVIATERLVGITGSGMQPARRIYYVLVRGWAHGRPGSPLSARRVCDTPAGPAQVLPSDHYGVLADLWDPPLERS